MSHLHSVLYSMLKGRSHTSKFRIPQMKLHLKMNEQKWKYLSRLILRLRFSYFMI